MIGKISKGKGFIGVLAYAAGETAKDQHATLLDQNLAVIPSTQNLARAFDERAELGRTKIPVLHFSLAPTEKDWKHFKDNPDKALAIASEYLELMGFDAHHPRAIYQHDEKNGSGHFHIITTNVLDSGKIWKSSKDHQRSMEACRTLEARYGLELVSSKPAEKRRAKKNEVEKYNRSGDLSPFEHIQNSIDDVLQNGLISQTEFAKQLAKAGIDVRYNQGKNGLNGAAFSYDGIVYTGSKFGNAYKGKGLEARGLCTDEAFAMFKDDFKQAGHPIFESVKSQILKAPTPKPTQKFKTQSTQKTKDFKLKVDEIKHKPTPFDLNLEPTRRGIEEKPIPEPSHKAQNPTPKPSKNRSVELEVQKIIKQIGLEFFGSGKDKQPTLDKQAGQALNKAGAKYSNEHIKEAIKKISQTHKVEAKALEKAHERIEQKRSKDATPKPFFEASSHSSSITVPKLTPDSFKAKKAERDRDASYNDDGSLHKSWDQMTEHEKNEYLRRKNAPKPTYKPTLGKW